MSLEVQQFLNDTGGNFTEMAPRPPVPGEETVELQSNGGVSTRSSGSHKSHLSGKSHSSSKSVTSSHRSDVSHSPAATPRRSNLDKTLCAPNASSTSCLDSKLDADSQDAPLGFEPEGSAANSPPFTEENSTPPYLKWAENLTYLLDDSDGVKLFKQFLDQDQCSNLLDFWFACKGLKMVGEDGLERLLKLIYKKYIKGDQLTLRPDIKRSIVDHLKREDYRQTMFDEAQSEVESLMKTEAYPQFLKSDLYLQYVRNGGESPKTSNNSSGSSSARPMSGPLPTLREDEMLSADDLRRNANSSAALPLTPASLYTTRRSREVWSSRKPESVYPAGNSKLPNPYHVSYAPVSAQDSELQSLSSDALTDDTMSLTDSSVDGRDFSGYGKKAWRKHQKAIKRYADTNKVTQLNQNLIPRTERAPKDRNLAEKEPEKFAAMLAEKLAKVKDEMDKLERMKENLQNLETDEEKESVLMPPPSCPPLKCAAAGGSLVAPPVGPGGNPLGVLLAMASTGEQEDNAQSILEDHVSRIWDSSNGQTPSRSPGRHSPKFSAHDLSFKYPYVAPGPSPNVSGLSAPGGLYTKASGRRGKDSKDAVNTSAFLSTSSYDSGLSTEDKSGLYYHDVDTPHKYVYHHHHHHHHVVKDTPSLAPPAGGNKSRTSEPSDPYGRGLHCAPAGYPTEPYRGPPPHALHSHTWDSVPPPPPRAGKDSKRSSAKKSAAADSSSNLDSGVGLTGDLPSTPLSSLNIPTNEKVLAWMLENDKVSIGNTQYSTDGSDRGSSQRRSSHKSSSNSQHKSGQSGGKKSSGYSGSGGGGRSSSLDRSGYSSFHQGLGDYSMVGASGAHGGPSGTPTVLPGQPIMQDLSMPPLNPPNTMTQIEEAKRRLEVESSRANMKLSKSFTGVPSSSSASSSGALGLPRDRSRAMPPPSYPTSSSTSRLPQTSSQKAATLQLAPLDLSSSEEHSSHGSHKSEGSRRGSRKAVGSVPSTPGTASGSAAVSSLGVGASSSSGQTVVGYFLCSEPIPYRTTLPGKQITLAQFKQLISKKGNYRYFFKTISDEFDSGVVHEEVTDDDQILPLWDNKIIGKVEKKD